MNDVHPTAVIDPSAQLGDHVRIGPYVVIEEGTVLGDRCSVGAHAVIKRYTRLGRDNRVFEHATIGGDPQDVKFQACASHVEVGDQNTIREGVTIHRGSTPGAVTRIGNSNFLMAYCHVAHDCSLGDEIIVANGTLLGGFVTVGDRAFISGAVTVHQFCRVGRLAMVAASARINQDCLPFVITDGVPGRARALNTVGLKRAGIAAGEIQTLKRAFRVLVRPETSLEDALTQLAALDAPLVTELLRFVRSSSRGFAHARSAPGPAL